MDRAYTNNERYLFLSDLIVKGLMDYAPTMIEVYRIGVVLTDVIDDWGTYLEEPFYFCDQFW